uniref:RING-type domain-containing protein n=1 Tax=Terrapene triunguis TaxID=2587831 RepID=A0A674JAX7_9SAUR
PFEPSCPPIGSSGQVSARLDELLNPLQVKEALTLNYLFMTGGYINTHFFFLFTCFMGFQSSPSLSIPFLCPLLYGGCVHRGREGMNCRLNLQDELSCPICLEYFTDPVIIECGHNFCRACISQCWGETEANFSCPQCRETALQRNLRPNRQLGKVVELVKGLRLQAVTEPEGQRVCERSHKVVPIEEAAQEYKVGN